ncbi:MAG: hypothetical protein M0Q21_11730 [Ignavibacteriaceae bacterium]|nr:hypothetical protein [Ignavibacteriaceae bacterium]
MNTDPIKGKYFFSCVLVGIVLLNLGCKKSPTEPPAPPTQEIRDTLTLTLKTYSHRSVTLALHTTAYYKTSSIKIIRALNGTETILANYSNAISDTLLFDDDGGKGLYQDTAYTYYALRLDTLGAAKDTSNTLTVKTLGLTTHEYDWISTTVGVWQSEFKDVWGIDENNIYAVGGVRSNNTTYGIMKWSNNEWVPEQVGGGMYAITGFSDNDIWVVGEAVQHYDGNQWKRIDATSSGDQEIPLNQVFYDNKPYRAIWGISSTDIYLGNSKGTIVHWDGKYATEIYKKSANFSIQNIDGSSATNIWVIGGEYSNPWRNLVLHFNGSTWQEITNLPDETFFPSGVYVLNEKEVYICGQSGLVYGNENGWQEISLPGNAALSKIKGINGNDIFLTGHFNSLYHYNGKDWHWYNELYNSQGGLLRGIFLINNKVWAVGYNEKEIALILTGKKRSSK